MSTEEEPLCPVCNLKIVPGCRNKNGGGGIIIPLPKEGEWEEARPCPNMRVKKIRDYLQRIHPQILKVPANPKSPLFSKNKGIDRTKDNLFFPTTDWGIFLSNLQWVGIFKCEEHFNFKVTTDMTLINIYVGNTNAKARLPQQRDDGNLLICNSVEDLLTTPDLAIIRLGILVAPNKRAAENLLSCLKLRRSLGLPTWIVEPPNKPFTPYRAGEFGSSSGMASCDDETLDYVNTHFEKVKLGSVPGAKIEEPQYYSEDEETDTVTIGDEAPSEFNQVVEDLPEEFEVPTVERSEDPADDHDPDVDEIMRTPKKSKSKSKFNKGYR